jgi:hypothetical protein
MATLTAGALRVADMSLGNRTTTVSVGGQRAVSVDLNRDAGRSLDLVVAGGELDATFTVAPVLDLRVAIDHGLFGHELPRYDVTRLALDGALRSTAARLEVAAGQLTIETNPVGYGATFAAGQCIVEEFRSDATGSYSVLVPTTCN